MRNTSKSLDREAYMYIAYIFSKCLLHKIIMMCKLKVCFDRKIHIIKIKLISYRSKLPMEDNITTSMASTNYHSPQLNQIHWLVWMAACCVNEIFSKNLIKILVILKSYIFGYFQYPSRFIDQYLISVEWLSAQKTILSIDLIGSQKNIQSVVTNL